MNTLKTMVLMVTLTLMFIVNPLSGGGLLKLFSTPPPMEERIERLKSMRLGGK